MVVFAFQAHPSGVTGGAVGQRGVTGQTVRVSGREVVAAAALQTDERRGTSLAVGHGTRAGEACVGVGVVAIDAPQTNGSGALILALCADVDS